MKKRGLNFADKPGFVGNGFAMLIGLLLLIEGILGMFHQKFYGVFTTNYLHSGIHIALGITGLAVSMAEHARTYCRYLGILLITVGLLRFIPFTDDLIVRLLNVNYPVAVFNLIVGAISLGISFLHEKDMDLA